MVKARREVVADVVVEGRVEIRRCRLPSRFDFTLTLVRNHERFARTRSMARCLAVAAARPGLFRTPDSGHCSKRRRGVLGEFSAGRRRPRRRPRQPAPTHARPPTWKDGPLRPPGVMRFRPMSLSVVRRRGVPRIGKRLSSPRLCGGRI